MSSFYVRPTACLRLLERIALNTESKGLREKDTNSSSYEKAVFV